MTIAFRHVARELAKAYAIIAATLLALFDLIAFLAEGEDIGQARYSVVDALIRGCFYTRGNELLVGGSYPRSALASCLPVFWRA